MYVCDIPFSHTDVYLYFPLSPGKCTVFFLRNAYKKVFPESVSMNEDTYPASEIIFQIRMTARFLSFSDSDVDDCFRLPLAKFLFLFLITECFDATV